MYLYKLIYMTRKKWFGLLTIAALLLHFAATAQTVVPLDLKHAVDLSLQNSKQLKLSKAKIEQSVARLRQALDNRLPEVKLSSAFLLLPHPNIDVKLGKDSGGGGSLVSPSQALYGMATVSMPLYSGLRVHYGIESAKFLEKAAESDAEFDKEKVVINTIAAYCNLYKSMKAVELVKENLSQSQKRDNDFSNLEKNGLLARNDLLKAQLQTSNIELALTNAENNFKVAMVSLNLMLGLPEETTLRTDTNFLTAPSTVASIAEYEQQALIHRKDVEALGLRKKAIQSSINAAKGEYYPSIGLTGGYIAAYIPNLVTATNVVNVGVGVQYNIGSLWRAKAKVDEQKANQNELNARNEILSDNIRLNINRAYQDYLGAKKKIEVQDKSVVNATENYRITKNKHDNNLVTTTELLEANVTLLQSKINLEEAKADLVLAYNRLLEESGSLNAGNQ